MKNKILSIPFDASLEKSKKYRTAFIDLVKTVIIYILTVTLSEFLYFFGFENESLIMVYILSVLITAIATSGYICSILATIVTAFTYDFFITEPRFGFSFALGFPITLFAMLIIAFGTSALTVKLKKQTELALVREDKALLLLEVKQKLLAARDLESIIKITNDYLIGNLNRSVIFYTKDPLLPDSGVYTQCPSENGDDTLFNSQDERNTAHDIYVNPKSADISSQTKSAAYYIPIVSKEKVLAIIGVSYVKKPLSQLGILFMQMLAAQVTLALELQYMSDEQNRILIDSEREKTRVNLLRAISHDLRTPLTSILGASDTILDQNNHLDNETTGKLIVDIKENAQWLIQVVENLLSITKISHDTMKLNKTMEMAEEVVAQSVSIIRKRFPDCYIHSTCPEDLLMVPMEPTLITQVIINLLENAIKNSQGKSLILFDVKNHGDYAEFSVSDTGKGISENILDNLFEIHQFDKDQSADSRRGMGIGLSICKTIIHAHGGTITGKNKQDGGAYFSFTLPLKEGDCDG